MVREVAKPVQPQPEAEYTFAKDKLSRSASYPLKRSLLDEALRSSSVYQDVWYVLYSARRFGSSYVRRTQHSLAFWRPNTVLEAHFSPEGKVQYFASGKVQVTVWAATAQERKVTEDLLIREGLPVLCRWIAKAQSAGNTWRGFVHTLTIERVGLGLRFREE